MYKVFRWGVCWYPAMGGGRLVERHGCEDKQPTPHVTSSPRPSPHPRQFSPLTLLLAMAAAWVGVEGLDCFKCGSVNGSDPWCGDPFHHNHSAAYLASPCLAGWKNRQGVFPASHCVKLSGYFYETSETMYVRGCTTDSGTLTVDTELGRQSHCGVFRYDGRHIHPPADTSTCVPLLSPKLHPPH
ncbi:uncharacterized protein LOC126984123 [Eriocheir sinensis]|uniref:uncharacterized protein LOC126984123 n=1 Tax=Eriocheir sinensis TaxID=95602 RepID=UPI0021C69863|nr:uncharacterized protein LOC126984123 [Eriocheir sinensis]